MSDAATGQLPADGAPAAPQPPDDVPGFDERRLAVGAVTVLGLLALPAMLAGYLAADWPGALSAAIGLGFVLVLFGAAAGLLAFVARRDPRRGLRGVGVLVAGAVVRVALYAATLYGLGQLAWIHRPSLALATVAAIAVTLAYELRLMAGMPRLFWLDTDLARPVASTTRSRTL